MRHLFSQGTNNMKTTLLLSAFCAAWLASAASAQSFQIEPSGKVLSGTPISIKHDGLPPGTEVVVSAERAITEWGSMSDKRVVYRSEGKFKTDGAGKLDLAAAKPLSGTYRKADARGLFWSMISTKASAGRDWKAGEVRFAVKVEGKEGTLASATLELMNELPEVKTEKVEKFPGAMFATLPGESKRPAIILLGGSEGGSFVTRGAAQLASHGFAVLALPYYSPVNWGMRKAELPDLPAVFADIPVERLNEAREWLAARPDVDATRIAVYGTSKGAEFALLAGVHLPWVTSIVAYVPADVVWEGWGPGVEPGKRSSFAVNGKPLPFVPYVDFQQEFMGFQTGEPVYIRRPQDKGRAANPAAAAAARIPIERIKAAVMLVAGQDDQVWASGMMAHNIAERRAEAKLDTVSLIYSDAGHALGGTGFNPTTSYNLGSSKMGGTPEGTARAQGDAWPKSIAFLKRTLGIAER
jgi:dienelactone hydrolase